MARLLLRMFIIVITGCQILRAALPALMCNVTKLNDASILYQIFGKPNSTNYYSSWEKENGIVIVARNSNYNKSVVKTLKNDSVELYACEDFLLYNLEWLENDGKYSQLTATCEVNCTFLMAKASPQVDDGFPVWGIVVVTLGVIFILGILWKKVCRGSGFQNNHSSQTNRPSSQSLTQSDAGAIMDNIINEKVSTDASPFLPERSDPENPEDVELTPLSVCHREPRSA